ncbi:MAG: nucleotidyltransferase family protein [Planctomycetes bacterium]|nr:nucleotidyltransferase family protein [Planctomycetota bacterium]
MAETLVKAVILARGLGTRMRRHDAAAALDRDQAATADTGMKAMIPIGRPFLDYVLSALADAGVRHVCLVIGPEHAAVREYYTRTVVLSRVAITFAIQERPLGTADAMAVAEAFAGGERFLMINSDNYYPTAAFEALRRLGRPGLAVFERDSLVREGNVDAARVLQFAVVRTGATGELLEIIEKPDAKTVEALGPEVFVSMNCWVFGPAIFRACASVGLSPRGELELTDAVRYSMASLGERYTAIPFRAPVLDLSSRADIAAVAARLAGSEVRL